MAASRTREDIIAGMTAIKRLKPGVPGTKRLVERFGDAPLCVRCRHDPLRNCRLTTAELIVEERPEKPEKNAWIPVAYNETELRLRVRKAGGAWHPERKLWLVSLKNIKAHKLEKRMVVDA